MFIFTLDAEETVRKIKKTKPEIKKELDELIANGREERKHRCARKG